MRQYILEFYDDLAKAKDRAVWLRFKHRDAPQKFVVYDGPDNDYAVADLQTALDMGIEEPIYYPLPEHYKNLSYRKLESIRKDGSPLTHWEDLLGRFSVIEGELLRFILHYKIPLKKIVRYELASRGFDHNNQWVGFKEAQEVWQK